MREWTSEDGVLEIAFPHSWRPGRADQSYGVHVARLAGVPTSVTNRAAEVLKSLSVQQGDRIDASAVDTKTKKAIAKANADSARDTNRDSNGQLGLFTEFLSHPVVDQLREVKLDEMTPMQAFDALRALKESADS